MPFVFFDTFELVGSEVELAAQMATFWTNFAATGDPNRAYPARAGRRLQPDPTEPPSAQGQTEPRTQGGEESQCGPYESAPPARLNGTAGETLHGLASVTECCAACARLYYGALCNGW